MITVLPENRRYDFIDFMRQDVPRVGQSIADIIHGHQINKSAQGVAQQLGDPSLAPAISQLLKTHPEKMADLLKQIEAQKQNKAYAHMFGLDEPTTQDDREQNALERLQGEKIGVANNAGFTAQSQTDPFGNQQIAREQTGQQESEGQVPRQPGQGPVSFTDNKGAQFGGKQQRASPFDRLTPTQVEGLAGQDTPIGKAAKIHLETQREQQKTDFKEKEFVSNQYNKYYEGLLEKADEAAKTIPNYQIAIKTNEAAKFGPGSWDNLVEETNIPFLRTFKSENAQKFEAQLPAQLAGFREKMGGVMTEAKLALIAKKAASVGKDKDANRLILFTGYYDQLLDILKEQSASEIIEQNGGFKPANFKRLLDQKMKPYQKMMGQDLDKLLKDKMPRSELASQLLGIQKPKNAHEKALLMRNPAGEMGWVNPDKVNGAMAAGFEVVK